MTHLSVELTFDTASFMFTPESTGFQKDQQQKDSATSATAGSIVHPEFNDLLAIKEGILNSVARIYFQTTPPQSIEEFKRFREYMEKMKIIIMTEKQELPKTMRHQERKGKGKKESGTQIKSNLTWY